MCVGKRRVWCEILHLNVYALCSEGSFVGAGTVEKSMKKGVQKSRQQGFPVGPMENPMGSIQFSQNWSRMVSLLKEEPKIMGNPEGQLFHSHSLGEMSLGKCKFSMGDVICEFKSGAKNGNIS